MAAAASSASSSGTTVPDSEAAAAAAAGPDISEPIKNLADLAEEHTREEGLRTLTVTGVSILTTTVIRQMLSLIYSVLTVKGVYTAIQTVLVNSFTWLASAPSVITVEFLVLTYLASYLGEGFTESILKPVIINLTRDPALREVRGKFLDNIREYVSFTRRTVDSHIMNAFVKSGGPPFIAAATKYVGDRFGEVQTLVASANLEAAGKGFVGMLSKIPLPRLPKTTRDTGVVRQQILDLREAIKLWVMSQAVKSTLVPMRAEGLTEAESMYKSIQDLEGRIVTLIGMLEAGGLSEKDIERYTEFGLPGLMGFFAERGAFRAAGAMTSRVSGETEALMSHIQDIANRLLYGDLIRKPKTRSIAASMTGRQLSIIQRVDAMNGYLEKMGVAVPSAKTYTPLGDTEVVIGTQYTHTGELVKLLIQLNTIAKELFTQHSGVVPEEDVGVAARRLVGRPQKGDSREVVRELDILSSDIRDSLVQKIESLGGSIVPVVKRGREDEEEEDEEEEDEDEDEEDEDEEEEEGSKRSRPGNDEGGGGRKTRRGKRTRKKHHKKSHRRGKHRPQEHHKKSRRRRKTVANRRGKRAHSRRRTNRRATKRSEK